jgi:hypothetical protein
MSTFGTKGWIEENRQRCENMSELYKLDERYKDSHPKNSTYSGLYKEILIYEKWRKRFYPEDQVCKYVRQ